MKSVIKEEDAIEEMEFEDGPDLKPKLLEWETFRNGNTSVDLNVVKKEENLFTSNGDDFDGAMEAKVEGGLEQVDELNEKQKVKVEAVEDVDVEEHRLSSFEGDACDIKAEQIANERHVYPDTVLSSESAMYKCYRCSFKSWHKSKYMQHVLNHEGPPNGSPKVTIFKCEECSFKTRRKDRLKAHMLMHKPTEGPFHKCTECSHETKHKRALKIHMLVHKKPSEITMHKCTECSYETKHKSDLKKHMLIHMKPSEVTNYKCEVCSFVTRYKSSLKHHKHAHKKPSEVTMHKCNMCPYETWRKSTFTVHMRNHKKPPSLSRSMTGALTK